MIGGTKYRLLLLEVSVIVMIQYLVVRKEDTKGGG